MARTGVGTVEGRMVDDVCHRIASKMDFKGCYRGDTGSSAIRVARTGQKRLSGLLSPFKGDRVARANSWAKPRKAILNFFL